MPSIDAWIAGDQDTADFDTESIINRDPVELVLVRGNSDIAAQTVRVVPRSTRGGAGSETDANNTASIADVVVIGDENLDAKKGDLFVFRGTRYKVHFVTASIPGQTQAHATGVQ